jgi:regulator of protease activity HflC (stomatin/prohibitin superfamily)
MGLEKLFDLIVQFLEFFRFCSVIDCYEKGVHLRKGKLLRVLEPGIRFMIPFYIDRMSTERVVVRVRELLTQTLITKDGKQIAAGIIIEFKIFDIVKAMLEVNEVIEAVDNACQATLAEHVLAETFADICTEGFAKALTTACNLRAEPFGIEIRSVRLFELAPVRTYRLIGSK